MQDSGKNDKDVAKLTAQEMLLKTLVSKFDDPFDTRSYFTRSFAKGAYKSIQNISIETIVGFVEKNPAAFSVFFKKRELLHAAFVGRNFRKEVGERPDLLVRLFNLAKNSPIPATKDAFKDLSKSSHFDHAGLESQKDFKEVKAQHDQKKVIKIMDEIKNPQLKALIKEKFNHLQTLPPKDQPTPKEMEKFVSAINKKLDYGGLTKNSYAKICNARSSAFFAMMTDIKLNHQEIYVASKSKYASKSATSEKVQMPDRGLMSPPPLNSGPSRPHS